VKVHPFRSPSYSNLHAECKSLHANNRLGPLTFLLSWVNNHSIGMQSAPELIHLADLVADVGDHLTIEGTLNGSRRLIPILGGVVAGPRLRGKVLPGGADFQTVRKDGTIDLHARYFLELEDGERIYVENSGFRHGPPGAVYFCTSARFECAAGPHDWLTRHIFVAHGLRHPKSVELSFFQLAQSPRN
jgi:hypothetical protein